MTKKEELLSAISLLGTYNAALDREYSRRDDYQSAICMLDYKLATATNVVTSMSDVEVEILFQKHILTQPAYSFVSSCIHRIIIRGAL